MKKFLFSLLVTLSCAGIFAQQKPVVAVAPFDVISSAVSAEQANMITDVFFVRLRNTNKVTVVNRNVVERVLKEHQFQLEDWSDEKKTAELAKALNANWIVQGNIRKSGSFLLIIVQFYDVKTFEVTGATDLRLANADEAYDKIDPLVNKLVETIAANQPPVPAYKVGDRGPGGGIIFFVENGVYMECSLDIGSYNWDDAMRAAQNYKGGGFTDWRLPTRGELDLMYKNLKQKGLGGFGSDWYWSSSQGNNSYAWNQYFSDGRQYYFYNKNSTISVRAVRAF